MQMTAKVEETTKGEGVGTFCATLKCNWVAWIVRTASTMELQVLDGDCPDMSGCVETAEELNDDVVFVIVREVESKKIINVYERVETAAGGSWSAKVPVQDAA